MTPDPAAPAPAQRSLVLVAGSGRSGTSLFSGVLQRLGFHVPQPEVPADETNPRGFGESQWVVDFHTKLLRRARVQVSDARPTAWTLTAQVALDEEVQAELRTWLAGQYREHDDLIIKDPRLSWFLPLWRQCAHDVGARPRFVTMLRHPAAVVDSKQKWYGGWQGDVGRTAGWVHQTLFTERATRESPRAFVRYEDLLEDWTKVVGRVGEVLDLAVIRDAPATRMRDVHGFVDRSLSRSRPDWGGARRPTRRGSSSPGSRTPRRPTSAPSSTRCVPPTSTSMPRPRRSRSPRSRPATAGVRPRRLPQRPCRSPRCGSCARCPSAIATACRCTGGPGSRARSAAARADRVRREALTAASRGGTSAPPLRNGSAPARDCGA